MGRRNQLTSWVSILTLRTSIVILGVVFLCMQPLVAFSASMDLETKSDWFSLVQLGGPVVLVLIAMSIVGLAVVFFKLLQYRPFSRNRLNELNRSMDLWVTGEMKEALAHTTEQENPVAEVLCKGMNWIKRGDLGEGQIREELVRQGQVIMAQLTSLLRLLEQIVYLSPLLGLLGTVLGIIEVFHGLAGQGVNSDPGLLAAGIWEALITTAVGLSVAIPFAFIHTALEGHVSFVRSRMEDLFTRLFTASLYAEPGKETG